MRTIDCPCGLTYDPEAGAAGCPRCGKRTFLPADAKIRFSCPSCRLRISADAASVGKTIDCMACARPVAVPAASEPEPIRPVTTTRRPPPKPAARPDGWRSIARWSLLAALVPLAIFTFADRDDLKIRIEETKKIYPNLAEKFESEKVDVVFASLPSHRLEGAAFSYTTKAHWILAILSALIFWEFILIIQPMGTSTSRQLWGVGIFTGTIGIMLLLVITVGGVVAAALEIPVLKYIGYSYGAAVNPDNSFLASMIGFTIGVGLLEEFCKALPIYWHYRKTATLDARGTVVWGLATGIGFGVSEGISYSDSFYNGIYGGSHYVVRFISCVALHAVWSATVAILIWKRQDAIHRLRHVYQWVPILFQTLSSSMVIHGFYDTCLKKNYGAAALFSAIFSFALFFWLYDRACREEQVRNIQAA